MLDINLIRQNPEKIKENNRIRKCVVSVDEILRLDDERKKIIGEADALRARMNVVSRTVSKEQIEEIRKFRDEILKERVREKTIQKPSSGAVHEIFRVKKEIKELESILSKLEDALNALLVQLPNITHDSVPIGKNDTENVVYKKWSPSDQKEGSIPQSDFPIKPHYEIGKALDLIDEEKGAKVSGSRFWYLKNELVYLEFALVHYALTFLQSKHTF